MNIQGGGMSFSFGADNKQLLAVINDSKKAIQQFGMSTSHSGADIDKAFQMVNDKIRQASANVDQVLAINHKAVDELKAKYKELGAEAHTAQTSGNDDEYRAIEQKRDAIKQEIDVRKGVISEAEHQADVLVKETANLRQNYEQAKKGAQAHGSLRTQLRNVREQLAEMEASGQRGTEAFRRLQQEAGRLTDAIGDANTQARILSHDNQGLQGMISGLQGAVGAFGVAQGAIGLFTDKNEELSKAMLKVQSLMSITMNLQQVANTLNKDSAFMLTTVARAKNFLSAANIRLATALGISTVAAKALMATLTLGLSVAITAIIVAIDKLSNKEKETTQQTDAMKKAFDTFHEETAKKSADLVGKYQRLRQEYSQLKNEHQKKEWIKENANEFDNLSLKVDNVTDADNVFVKNTAKVITALELRAKAMALQNMQMAAYEEYYKKTINAERHEEYKGETLSSFSDEWKKAGVTMDDVDVKDYQFTYGYTAKKSAIDKVNAYRMQQAKITGKKIIADAQTELDKTINYTKNQLELTENEIKALNILKAGGSGNSEKNDKGGKGGSNGKSEEERYADQLNTRKQLYAKYLKWVTSEDETVRNQAPVEFEALLKQGSSYLDYLERQRDSISGKANKTATDLKHLSKLNDEIASATKEKVIADFTAQLNTELAQCKTLSQQLDLIAKRKEELKDDSSEVGTQKTDILDTAEKDTKDKVKEETAALLQEYAGYLQEKIDFEESYARNRDLLEKRIANATSENEKQAAEAALAALEKKQKEYEKRSGSEQYDTLLTEYTTLQQKQTAIQEKYAEQRAEAEKQGNLAMIQQINTKEQAELSKLATQRLMATESWNQLFTDLSNLSTSTINKLIADISSKKVQFGAEFSPTDLKTINAQLEQARNIIRQRNPFLALRDSLAELRQAIKADKLLDSNDPFVESLKRKKEQYQQFTEAINSGDEKTAANAKTTYADLLRQGTSYIDMLKRKIAELENKKLTIGLDVQGEEQLDVLNAALKRETGETKTTKQAFKENFKDIASSVQMVAGCFDAVVDGIKKMGVSMDEETEAILSDISGMMDGAAQFAKGYESMNPVQMISGTVGFLSSAFSLFNTKDRKAEKAIKQHQAAVKKLGEVYSDLQRNVEKALGSTVYQNQNAMIKNLREQQEHFKAMWEAEEEKKKTNHGRVDEFKKQYKEAGQQIEDIIEEITNNITQTTAKDLAGNLADALVEAFEAGKDSAKAFGDVANDVLRNAVKNALKLKFLDEPLQAAIKQLQKDMGYDEEGNGAFDGLTEQERNRFKDAVAKASKEFNEAIQVYDDLFKDVADPSTLSGALSTASQESIDLLAGQTNAVRQNQVQSMALVRQQLLHLSNMDRGISTIAERVLKILNKLPQQSSGTDLRSQGITD